MLRTSRRFWTLSNRKMIGLKRQIVRQFNYNPSWADLAAQACQRVLEVGADLIVDVQHVGSTAVPGLSAKPILDLAAAVKSLYVVPELIKKLTVLGYIYRGDGQSSGGHLFVWESEPDVRTIHLHVVTLGDIQWTNYLRFRDLLRQEISVQKQYAVLIMCDRRLAFLRNFSTWSTFGKGWERRVHGVRAAAIAMAGGSSQVIGAIAPSVDYTIVKKGSRGSWVRKLQEALKIQVDGKFGSDTEAVLKAWQQANGLEPDGIAGRNTGLTRLTYGSAGN